MQHQNFVCNKWYAQLLEITTSWCYESKGDAGSDVSVWAIITPVWVKLMTVEAKVWSLLGPKLSRFNLSALHTHMLLYLARGIRDRKALGGCDYRGKEGKKTLYGYGHGGLWYIQARRRWWCWWLQLCGCIVYVADEKAKIKTLALLETKERMHFLWCAVAFSGSLARNLSALLDSIWVWH